jgi:hypothetical protein
LKKLREELKEANMQLWALKDSIRAFAYALMAFTSVLTDDPYIIGTDSVHVSLDELNKRDLGSDLTLDLREYGKQREFICWRLKMEAVKAAAESRVMSEVSAENASTCELLAVLENSKASQLIVRRTL